MEESRPALSTTLRVSHHLAAYQLLELPDELVALIESGTAESLRLKSKPATESSDAVAVVTTTGQTFEVRQAQSSNSLYILRPETTGSSAGGIQRGVTAVAQCKAALELAPIRPQAVSLLMSMLPTHDGQQSSDDARDLLTRAHIEADMPCSAAEFADAWRELCAFEIARTAWRPSIAARLGMWRSIHLAAAACGVKLSEPFDGEELRPLVEEDGYHSALYRAVLSRMVTEKSMDGLCRLERNVCGRWVGATILENAGIEGLQNSELIERWREMLPDIWEADAQLDTLTNLYIQKEGRIVFADPNLISRAKTSDSRPQSKWHSKFAT